MMVSLQYIRAYQNKWPSIWVHGGGFLFILALLTIGFMIGLVLRKVQKRLKLIEAVDAELAVAQELEKLRNLGCEIFHDMQTGKFNIDHVVVGPGSVYAVETKSRLKPTTDNRKADATVIFDEAMLRFPDWSESEIFDQTRNQAKWLAEKLSHSTGVPTSVKPVLALPMWFVKDNGKSDILVINPRLADRLSRPHGQDITSTERIRTISYQLEQLCTTKA